MTKESFDVIILGGGPAGLTSAIYTSRHGLNTLVIEGMQLGGKSWGEQRIENYPGFPHGISGTELMERFIAQAKRFGTKFKKETAIGLMPLDHQKLIQTRAGVYEAKAVIIATGIQKKQLSIPGENEFKGRGVSYCAICDGPFFTDKVVAVIGRGKDAVEDILKLADIARTVYAIPGFDGYDNGIEEVSELFENEIIQVIENAELKSIAGEMVVTHLYLDHESIEQLDVDGVFIILDKVPSTELMKEAGIATDAGNCIIVDRTQMTNLAGVFAAGDCICSGMQIITAAGDGGRAGLSTLRYVRALKKRK
jgi:thioredoxin reductase (NADPH)